MGISERKERQKTERQRILDASREIVQSEGVAGLTMRTVADAIENATAHAMCAVIRNGILA